MSRSLKQRSSPSWSLADLLAAAPSDGELLGRFVGSRDQTAFELLLRRHAGMVLGVCRRMLTDPNDADDAFQAAFLVLARKAGSIARKDVVASWLHRVAIRAALRVRGERARWDRFERSGIEQIACSTNIDSLSELYQVLDQEVSRLPTRQRDVIVLCCLEGKSGEEAGNLLGCPAGTVSSRLTRARERLRRRLIRRGFAPAAIAAIVWNANGTVVGSTILVESVVPAAMSFSSGQLSIGPSARPAIIAKGVMRAMVLNKLRLASILVVGLLAVGAVLVEAGSGAGSGAPQDSPPIAKKKVEEPKDITEGPKVKLIRPTPGGMDRIAEQSGVVEPYQKADLFPYVAGQLKSVSVNIGDSVKAGQVLAEIDAPDLEIADKQAKIAVEHAESLLKAAARGVVTAKAGIEVSRGQVRIREVEAAAADAQLQHRQKQLDRIKALADKVSREVIDDTELQFQSTKSQAVTAKVGVENAKASLNVQEAKVSEAEAAESTARANLETAKLGLVKAQLALARGKILAPFDGVVTRCNGSAGDYVRGGEASREPILTVMRIDILRVVVGIPERYSALAKKDIPAEVHFDALPGFREKAKVTRVGVSVEGPMRTIRAELEVPNPRGMLRPGMTGEVILNLGPGPIDAVRVPPSAVFRLPKNMEDGEKLWGIYVYRDGKARLLKVRSDYSGRDEIEVIGGLTRDDLVIVDPVPVLREQTGLPDELPRTMK